MVVVLNTFKARPRFVVFTAIVAGLSFALPREWSLPTRLLVAWDTGALVYVALIAWMAWHSDVAAMRRRAVIEDEGAVVTLILTAAAAVASLAAIGFEFANLAATPAAGDALRLTLAGCTILFSWLLMHMTFALHYAHEFYGERGGRGQQVLRFPEAEKTKDFEPDYWDFMYFSANLGAASQTSDVMIASRRVRRIVLGQTVLSFLFNTTVLALGVNIAASIVGG